MENRITDRYAKLYRIFTTVLFPALLFLYPLRHIRYGVEWWDTGYNYGNFVFMDRMDPMWVFSTYLANAVGRLFTRLPFGDRMIGLNFYTGLTVSILAVGGYYFFTRKVKMPAWLVCAGELIAVGLCWCPTALLYNYLTYVLFFAGTICLYLALAPAKEDKGHNNKYFVLAGICLGINVFVRFPNLAEMALITAVWAYAIIRKKKVKKVLAETGWCLLGYVVGLGSILGYLCIRYGLTEYLDAINRLFSMTGEATDYTLYSMVLYQLQNFAQNFRWLFLLFICVLIGMAGFRVLPGRFVWLKRAGFLACTLLVFRVLMNRNMFNMKYSTKMSVFQWAVSLMSLLLIVGLFVIFRKKAEDKDKLLCGLAILTVLVTPLGSNNHLYSSMNNLFFAAPVALWMLWKYVLSLKAEYLLRGKLHVDTFPLRAMVGMLLLMLLVQSIGFGFGYVFSESDGGENLHTKIENSAILKGMYTDPVRAEQLGTLLAYVEEQRLTGKELVLYGNIPALSYYLDMPFAISSWPDLTSYNYEVMKRDMELVEEKIKAGQEPPVLLCELAYGTYLTEGGGGLERLGIQEIQTDKIEKDRKFALLIQFAEEYGYTPVFTNSKFVLFEAEGGTR